MKKRNLFDELMVGVEALKKDRKQYENDLTVARWEEYQKTGETISNDAMTDWLESWGTNQEKGTPQNKRSI